MTDDDVDDDVDFALEDTLTDAMFCLICGREVIIVGETLHHVDDRLDREHAPVTPERL